jgi:hypothetical protein
MSSGHAQLPKIICINISKELQLHDQALIYYTNGCLCSNVTPDGGHDARPKHVEFLEIKAKTQLHFIGYICTY